MKIHIESVHEGKKPHLCSFCTASFGVKSNLTRHIKQVHEEQKSHQCTGKSFSEALILASVNQQYEKRLFIEFPQKIQV